MAVLVDPQSGAKYDYSDLDAQEVEKDRREFGLISPEDYEKKKKWEALNPLEKAGDYATALPQAVARGAMAPGMALQKALTGKLPGQVPQADLPPEQRSATSESVFGPEAQARKERHPLTAGLGESAPAMLAGGTLGGLAAGGALSLPVGAGLMAGESALQGVSQEAIDSITSKRDFSGKAALINGGVDLAFSTLMFGLAHGGGKLLGREARAAAGAGAEAVEGAVEGAAEGAPKRNWVAELDPGEVPEAIGGGRRGARPARSVGARGDTPETLPAHEVEHFIRNEDAIVDDMRTVAGGGPGEKGAFQDFNESFREVTANRIKRQDFDAAESLLDPAAKRELDLATDQIADELHTVASTLEARGAKRQAGVLRAHIAELGASANKTGILDRAKQTLDDLHMRAIVDKTDPYGEVLDTVNPAVERIRSTLEDPRFVGDKIAELQQVRNSAWSDKDTGFIRNMQIANETGVKLFKKIDRDYHTGDLVMQFDPGAFKQLLALDAHESKPVLEAWAKVLDSAERMAANTVEAGAQSAGRAPLGKLNDSIGAIREIFTTQDKRLAARDLARPGQELLSRVEQLPGVGTAIKGAKAVLGKDRVESFVAGAASRHIPVRERSVARAREALTRHAQPPPGAARPSIPPEPPTGGAGAAGAPQAPPGSPANDVSPAARRARELIERRRAQGGFTELGVSGRAFDPAATKATIAELPTVSQHDLAGSPYPMDRWVKMNSKLSEAEADAVREYKGDNYREIRALLRGETPQRALTPRDMQLAKDAAVQIEPALEKLSVPNPTAQGPLYRGMKVNDAALAELMSEDVLHTATITSSSYNPREALKFAATSKYEPGKYGVVFKVERAERGALMNPDELEVLLPKGGKYQITDRSRLASGELLVTVRQAGTVTTDQAKNIGAMGFVSVPAGGTGAQFAKGLAGSPLGLTVGAGALGLGGYKASQLLPDQQKSRDDLSAQLATLPPEEQQAHLRTAEAFARIQQKTESRVKGAVTDLFALAKDPKAKPRYRSPEAKALDQRSVQLDVPRHLARFMGKTDDPVDAWRDKSALINSVVSDPAKLARTMAENLGDLPRQQPEMFASMVGQTMATVQYLHERMPGVAGQSALDPHGYPPTFEEISEWAGHWVGAIHPLDSLDDLASNELVPEQIEAVQSLWPEGYAMFQASAMAQIHALSQKRGVIPLEALEQIDSALDLDGAGEPILSSAFAGLLKQATAKDAEKMKAEAPKQLPPMQSQSPSRLASSSLASFHSE